MRWRRHKSAVARSCGDPVVGTTRQGDARLRAAGATVVCKGVLGTQRRLYRFTHPTDPAEARGGIAGSLK